MKLYVCNKAGECDDTGCIHHGPHHKRKDGEENYWEFLLSCTRWRTSNRCREKVRCLIAGSDKLNEHHDYEDCTYFDEATLECCNGVDEGTICAGYYGLQCEAYERYFWDYIELLIG